MEFSTYRMSFLWLLGLCLLIFKAGPTEAQGKRASRITSSRSFGTNVKSTSSNGLSFDCPEEFGYYPHPTDCTQYYVCVFGGALLESCTGGLMYSHELQTCDWPRNVGCELVDTSTERGPARGQSQTQQQQHHQQHVPSRVRFGSAFSSPGGAQKAPTVAPQYHRSPPQVIQAQVHNIPPPPPELRVPPNPVVTSRGQPKPLLDAQEDIAKLYAEAQETLPPAEEEESDRQQRVYRGQPSTVSQVQRDRDGIIHQASINAIPQSGKLSSYAFGTAYSESLNDEQTLEYELSHNGLEARTRKRRELTRQTTAVADTATETTTTPEPEPKVQTEMPNDSNTSSEVMETESSSTLPGNDSESNNSEEHYDEVAPVEDKIQKYSSKISQRRETPANAVMEFDYAGDEAAEDEDERPEETDAATGESKRRPRQLRPLTHTSAKWPAQNYREIDNQGYHQHQTGQSYSFGNFNPYLTPPASPAQTPQPYGNHNYNKVNAGYPAQAYLHQQQQISTANQQKPKVVYTGYNLSLPPPPLEDDFRPIAGNYFGAPSNPRLPPQNLQQQHSSSGGDLLPYLIQQLKELKERRKNIQAENFAYFHLDNQPVTPATASAPAPSSSHATTTAQTPFAYYSHSHLSGDPSKPTQQVTPVPKGQYSTMGGFYNNQGPDHGQVNPNYPGKLVSQYSIGSTTESNYFQYNVIANQKMKGVYSTAKPNQVGQVAVKVRPPVTPLQVTQSINIVSAPNLAYNRPNTGLQQVPFRDFSHIPVGISYTGNSTVPESYQTFTKTITSTEAPATTTTADKPKLTNFQFNIHEFMANLKSSDLASVNPAINPLIKYFKQLNSDVQRRPVALSSTTTIPISTTLSTSTPKPRQREKPTITTTSRPLKGYESFIKGIQNQINKQTSSQSAAPPTKSPTTPRVRPTIRTSSSSSTTTTESVDYYDEDYEEDDDILPPSHLPPYMPMSETMAPPRPQLAATTAPVTGLPVRNNFQTGFMEATTTRRPFPNFAQLNSRPSTETGTGVPSFINFPSDIFQELKQRLPQSTTPTSAASTTQSTRPSSTTASTSTSTRMRYTTRPRTRGQQKWMTMAPAAAAAKGVENNTKRAKNESNSMSGYYSGKQSHSSLGGLQLNSVHIVGSDSGGDRHRNNNRNRGGAIYANQDRDVVPTANRGTHPPRTRPTLKPSGTIVSKAQEFVDIYRYPPTRPDPIYPQPTPDKTAAKCRKDVCLLPDCYCGGRDIPGGLNVTQTPQIVLITFDDAINPINIDIYAELFNNKTRKNPNGCPWRATFYLSHEWTDYGMVQDLYADGHEMASHTVSHSFGEQFSQKKWTREIAGQREILAAYGGVKLSDVRGMRAPFLSVGGNKMYKMLYDSNFTYDSSMPVYENRPPSWPYTLDYKIFHDCMIPPCPTRSYPGVWQVPMVMWQDLNGGRCSMGDACSNPSDAEGVTKMIMKNFERHYTTNRAPFGLFYHAAWFTQPHHKEGFIKFLDAINAMPDVWILTNWQALQWVRDPTPISRINSFQPFQCDYSDRPKRCNNPKVCNLWHKSGVRYMKTCQPCPDIYPWTGKSGIRSSRIDNDNNVEEPAAA
ncbi:uncharacterized protein LOC117900202 isoform X6 [Drosophila subobscura]|uniref:uncharacterized protein LOC117900202 isoform X6 n=1 Tax=Drosophila subobscura TaxID=7241 RepID=UPI00155A8470|nr:uncharacterized protein LOC117900202 isoform X6 [Drosophila subobscura]